MNSKKIYFWAILSKITIIFITIITTALINRSLGVMLKGEYAYIINIVTIFEIIISIGLGITYGTFKRKKLSFDIRTVFVSLILYLGIFSFFFGLLLFFYNYSIALALLLTSFTIIKSNFLAFAAIDDIKKRDKTNIVLKFIYLFLIILMFLLFKKNIYCIFIIYIIDCILSSIIIFKTYNFKLCNIKDIIKNKEIKNIIITGIITMQMQLLISFNYNIDIIILKKMTNLYYVGIYSVSVYLANMIWIVPDAFKDVLYHKTSREDSINDIIYSTKINLLLAIFEILFFFICGKVFINILYGKEFLESFYPTLILFFGGISMIIYKMIHPLYVSKGKQKVVLLILLISVVLNIALNVVLIPKYNIFGAAISSVFSYSLCSVIFIFIFKKDYNVSLKEMFFINIKDVNKIKIVLKNRKRDINENKSQFKQ